MEYQENFLRYIPADIEKYKDKDVVQGITFHPVSNISEVLDLVFV